ncbi:hypothetical protein Zmor_011935 [Zophobas morio]|jgi:hypothetical protein|uniref:Uncharacterized protein n=1 Tax=Zophobas morio TaxID=2755281 RepID=A0AA38HIX7_9CUCU|nr:hypothetical protein Zmor_011935 [Zophobas morio]
MRIPSHMHAYPNKRTGVDQVRPRGKSTCPKGGGGSTWAARTPGATESCRQISEADHPGAPTCVKSHVVSTMSVPNPLAPVPHRRNGIVVQESILASNLLNFRASL